MTRDKITRIGTAAVIEHEHDPALSVRLELGPLASTLSDREILALRDARALSLAATSIASPQLRWDEARERWRPCGRAMSFVVADANDPVVLVDDLELGLAELAEILASHGAHVLLAFLDD